MAGKPRNLGLSYIDKTGVRRWREWRGIKDTLVDYGWWCVMWKDMIKFVLQSPLQVVKGIFAELFCIREKIRDFFSECIDIHASIA